MRRLLTFLALAVALLGQAAVLQWNVVEDPQVTGYKVYVGTNSRSYDRVIDVGAQTYFPLVGFTPGVTYYLAVTAYAADGLESDFSEEITWTPRRERPRPPAYLIIRDLTVYEATQLTNWQAIASVPIALTNPAAIYKLGINASP